MKMDFQQKLIVEKDIVFEIKDEFKGWFIVDLKPYEIYLDKETEDIAVTIQWVESKKGKMKKANILQFQQQRQQLRQVFLERNLWILG
ncbi:MAG: hypothetical protein MZV63_05890 [Marinilabiliales bacterium]|nr:hypothetical protein [Marinilabiliales bacterium]